MFEFSQNDAIKKLESDIQKTGEQLEKDCLSLKEQSRIERQYSFLAHELRRLNQCKEWFNEKNVKVLDLQGQTRKQIKRHQFQKCWVNNNRSSRTKTISSAVLVQRLISEGKIIEAQRSLNKLKFEQEVRPNFEIVAKGIELDLISFVAEDLW